MIATIENALNNINTMVFEIQKDNNYEIRKLIDIVQNHTN